ncbi:MAG: hypothetical protein EXR79_09840 [Myxococcales bacterium]|nr:hypothetical protein [Myxococcales bacterium]
MFAAFGACAACASTPPSAAGPLAVDASSLDTSAADATPAGGTAKADTVSKDGGVPEAGALADTAADTGVADGAAPPDVAKPTTDIALTDAQIGSAAAEFAAWHAKYIDAWCKAKLACDPYGAIADLARCKTLVASQQWSDFGAELAAVAAGMATYNATSAAACLQTLDGSCAYFESLNFSYGLKMPAPCHSVAQGIFDDGAACMSAAACKSGFCVALDGVGPKCPGECESLASKGDECEFDDDCEGALWCRNGECSDGTAAKFGEDCAGWFCDKSLTCKPKGTDELACGPPLDVSATCAPSFNNCKPDTWCKQAKAGAATGKCTAAMATGAPCTPQPKDEKDPAFDTWEGQCGAKQACLALAADASPVCANLVDLGASCASTLQCNGLDAWCSGVTGKCAVLPDKAAECAKVPDGFDQCRFPYVCDSAASKCAELPAVGQACIGGWCAGTAWCNDKEKCAAEGKKGDVCEDYGDEGDTCVPALQCGKAGKCEALACP